MLGLTGAPTPQFPFVCETPCPDVNDEDADGPSLCGSDCDDQNPDVKLGPAELCGDGVDHVPVGVMRSEHDSHGCALAVLATLTNDHAPPPDGCGTWRALYVGTRKLTDDVMAHASLDNNVLSPRSGA